MGGASIDTTCPSSTTYRATQKMSLISDQNWVLRQLRIELLHSEDPLMERMVVFPASLLLGQSVGVVAAPNPTTTMSTAAAAAAAGGHHHDDHEYPHSGEHPLLDTVVSAEQTTATPQTTTTPSQTTTPQTTLTHPPTSPPPPLPPPPLPMVPFVDGNFPEKGLCYSPTIHYNPPSVGVLANNTTTNTSANINTNITTTSATMDGRRVKTVPMQQKQHHQPPLQPPLQPAQSLQPPSKQHLPVDDRPPASNAAATTTTAHQVKPAPAATMDVPSKAAATTSTTTTTAAVQEESSLFVKLSPSPATTTTAAHASSQLGLLITRQKSSANSNPFAKDYAYFCGKGERNPLRLRIYLPHCSQPPPQKPQEPLAIVLKRDATVEEAIGYTLYAYVEERRLPLLADWNAQLMKITSWNMRIVEDDGTIDEDFPGISPEAGEGGCVFVGVWVCTSACFMIP